MYVQGRITLRIPRSKNQVNEEKNRQTSIKHTLLKEAVKVLEQISLVEHKKQVSFILVVGFYV